MELVTRMFLVCPPHSGAATAPEPEPAPAKNALAASDPLIDRLVRRAPAAVIGGAQEGSWPLLLELEAGIGAARRLEPRLDPRAREFAETFEARVLTVLDELAREFQRAEIVIVLPADGIRAAAAHALGLERSSVISPEPGQAVALDWPHPDAREFKPALVAIGIDWDL